MRIRDGETGSADAAVGMGLVMGLVMLNVLRCHLTD